MKTGMTLALFLAGFCANSQEHDHAVRIQQMEFIANKGQWLKQVNAKCNLNGGTVWLENKRFTYVFHKAEDMLRMHEENHSGKPYAATSPIHYHAFYLNFVNAAEPEIVYSGKYNWYTNYFLGNDPSAWASMVPSYAEVEYKNMYTGVDVRVYGVKGDFKYDYQVDAGVDPSVIRFNYEGVDKIEFVKGDLVIHTSVGNILEKAPYAYQFVNGNKRSVSCRFREIEPGVFGFEFPNGYNKKQKLIIDPTVIAATYSGSTATLYGHTATYDNDGNIYSAGADFSGIGYPTTAGAFDETPNGGRNIALTKFVPDGSAHLWATYIGGTLDDFPHSMIVNSSNELCILGSSRSTDFPVTTGAYDETNNGGVDIIVVRLNTAGSALVGSTFVGGSAFDGQNSITDNYGDSYKGEISLDPAGDILVASMSASTNFPVTTGAVQSVAGGGQDGVAFKINAALTSMIWCTYLGASGDDAAYSIVELSPGNTYVCGTASTGFTTTAGVVNPAYLGGTADGFICSINATGTAFNASSFLGTASRDQSFFVQVDKFGKVYVMGQTQGTMTPTAGAYVGPSTGSYILRLESDLSVIDLVSTYGKTAPTAFLVDNCQNIYAAGHGGLATLAPPNYEASAGAFITTGAGFYLMVLKPNATALHFATFYGNSGAHVDGGTSRFDPNGVVYENVCSSAGSPTMSWAYATACSASWDSYVFKIDFEATGVVATASVDDLFSCDDPPYNIDFTGEAGIPDHYWDFGDGSTSTLQSPTHTYTEPGTYDIMYVVIDSSTCNVSDTAYATFTITQAEEFAAQFSVVPPPECSDTLWVQASFSGTGADSIVWDLGNGITVNDTSVNYAYTVPGTYVVTMTAYDNVCNNTGSVSQTFVLDDKFNGGAMVIPNVFTPNNDEKNKLFKPGYKKYPGMDPFPDLLSYDVLIYDRWGVLVFESAEDRAGWAWDGNFKGKPAAEGVYYYIMHYESSCNDSVEKVGFVTLGR